MLASVIKYLGLFGLWAGHGEWSRVSNNAYTFSNACIGTSFLWCCTVCNFFEISPPSLLCGSASFSSVLVLGWWVVFYSICWLCFLTHSLFPLNLWLRVWWLPGKCRVRARDRQACRACGWVGGRVCRWGVLLLQGWVCSFNPHPTSTYDVGDRLTLITFNLQIFKWHLCLHINYC